MTLPLDEVVRVAAEHVQKRCPACIIERGGKGDGVILEPCYHMCRADIAVLREVALATWEMTCKAAAVHDTLFVEAEIKRLLPGLLEGETE